MISLRTLEGIDLDRLEKEWGTPARQDAEKQLEKYVSSGHVSIAQSQARLTDTGMLLADGIASDLFRVSEKEGY